MNIQLESLIIDDETDLMSLRRTYCNMVNSKVTMWNYIGISKTLHNKDICMER